MMAAAAHLYARYLKILVYTLILTAPLICYGRMHKRWDTDSPGFNKDLLTYKNELRIAVPSEALCIVGEDLSPRIFLYYIDKKGWVLGWDGYNRKMFDEMIQKGARFLYSDSREIDEDPSVIPYLEEQVSEFGTIRIFRLTPVK